MDVWALNNKFRLILAPFPTVPLFFPFFLGKNTHFSFFYFGLDFYFLVCYFENSEISPYGGSLLRISTDNV